MKKGAASSYYNRMYNLNEKRNRWQVAFITVSLRRQGAEKNIVDLEARLTTLEARAVENSRILASIRPARDTWRSPARSWPARSTQRRLS